MLCCEYAFATALMGVELIAEPRRLGPLNVARTHIHNTNYYAFLSKSPPAIMHPMPVHIPTLSVITPSATHQPPTLRIVLFSMMMPFYSSLLKIRARKPSAHLSTHILTHSCNLAHVFTQFVHVGAICGNLCSTCASTHFEHASIIRGFCLLDGSQNCIARTNRSAY